MSALLEHDTKWPDVTRVPHSPSRAWIARVLLERVARRLRIRVSWPDGTVTGTDRADRPRLVLNRPGDFFHRLGVGGLIGFGEAYQAGDWDSPDLVELLTVLASHVDTLIPPALQRLRRFYVPAAPVSSANTLAGSRRNIARHYDLSNELFGSFLDETLTYSSALFPPGSAGTDGLAAAQRRKIDRLLDSTAVGPGRRVLEIGTGWGELAIRAAQRGATVDTITLSRAQLRSAAERIAAAGVGDRVRPRLMDYRELEPSNYDAVVSVEMIEAVGQRQWPRYFQTLDRLLTPAGRVGLQAIAMRHDRMMAARHTYTWIHKYIFPGGLIPSVKAIEQQVRSSPGLRIRDRLDFGPHYARTLRAWRDRFEAATDSLASLGFDKTFHRTWRFYLAYSESGFRSGYLTVHQFVLGRP